MRRLYLLLNYNVKVHGELVVRESTAPPKEKR